MQAFDEAVARALREIQAKSLVEIHIDTAKTWAARAIAYRLSAEQAAVQGEPDEPLRQGYDDSRHEALEHAALAEDDGEMVREISQVMRSWGAL